MNENTDEMLIPFPCCPSAKVIVSGDAAGSLSTRCPVCGKFARFDLGAGTAEAIRPAKGAVHRLRLRDAAAAGR